MVHPATSAQLAALAAVPLSAVVDTANPAEIAAVARLACNYYYRLYRGRNYRGTYIGAWYLPADTPPAYTITPPPDYPIQAHLPMYPAARLTDSQLAAIAVRSLRSAAGIFRALAQPPAGGYSPAEQAIADRLAAYLLDTD